MRMRRCRGCVKGSCLSTAARGTRSGERICAASPSCGSPWPRPDLRCLLSFRSRPDTDLVCLTNRRNRSYYRNEIGLPCSAAPISGDDQPAHPVAVPRERDGAYSEKNQGGHAVLSEMSCPGVTNSSDGGDPTRYEFPRHSGYDAAGRSLAIPFVAGRHGFSICIRDDMRRCRRENCDDSRGCSLRDQRAPR